jgi:hypothetical protein
MEPTDFAGGSFFLLLLPLVRFLQTSGRVASGFSAVGGRLVVHLAVPAQVLAGMAESNHHHHHHQEKARASFAAAVAPAAGDRILFFGEKR